MAEVGTYGGYTGEHICIRENISLLSRFRAARNTEEGGGRKESREVQ